MGSRVIASFLFMLAISCEAHAQTYPTFSPPFNPAPPASAPGTKTCTSPQAFFTSDCPLSWYGVTVFGAIDVGGGYQTHGVPLNDAIPTGVEELVSKNSNRSLFLPVPNGLSQSFLGIKVKEPLASDWSFIGELSFGFDPYTLTLADGPRSLLENNGIPLDRQTAAGDSSRGGQIYNSTGYFGLSNVNYGTLTFGRQNTLGLDGIIAYDPMGASYAFSPIGYSGAPAGGGDTETARSTTALKYRVDIGLFRIGALYQVGGYDLDNGSKQEYNISAGATFPVWNYGTLAVDGIYSSNKGAVASGILSPSQNLAYPGTLAATISDNDSFMLLGKYSYKAIKLFAGYEKILYQNPSSPQLTSFIDISGIPTLSSNINNSAYNNQKTLEVIWGGARYALTDYLDVGAAYYRESQNSYYKKYCNNSSQSSCSGTLNAVSFDADWSVNKKFDVYAGVMYSGVLDGMASGYLHRTNVDPTVGLRFRF